MHRCIGLVAGNSSVTKLVQMVMERNYEPVIVFSFNRRECEAFAMGMPKMDFNSEQEKVMVDSVFTSAIEILSPDERRLPQIINTLPLLRRGIGIHHSGLLPLIKETIELLFQEGLIKEEDEDSDSEDMPELECAQIRHHGSVNRVKVGWKGISNSCLY